MRWILTATRGLTPALLIAAAATMLVGLRSCDDGPDADDPAQEPTGSPAATTDAPATAEAEGAESPSPAGQAGGGEDPGKPQAGAGDGGEAGKPGEGPMAEGPVTLAEIAGSWGSEGCGRRTYAREVVLLEDGTFVRRDLVSPCPPGTRCVWSGILNYRGQWNFDGTAVALGDEVQVGAAGGGDMGGPGPRKLVFQVDPPRLINPLASGSCEYAKVDDRDVSAALKMKPLTP